MVTIGEKMDETELRKKILKAKRVYHYDGYVYVRANFIERLTSFFGFGPPLFTFDFFSIGKVKGYVRLCKIKDCKEELIDEDTTLKTTTKTTTKCPKGHTNIDYKGPEPPCYVYCYDCGRKYFQEDYDDKDQ
jgi:hypothetical protein